MSTAAELTILVADDDPAMLAAVRARLTADGFDVIAAQDAYQALELARRTKPDLLLLDINMPAGDGFSVRDRLKNVPDLEGTPVVFMTGDASAGAGQVEGVELLRKPFEAEDLLCAMWSNLQDARA